MEAALQELYGLGYSTQIVSLYESYLTVKWLGASSSNPNPDIAAVNQAVEALFAIDPTHDLGRIGPFRWTWKVLNASGRKTVWNVTTRGEKLATTIFAGDDIRNGLLPNAAQTVHNALSGRPLPSWQSLGCLILRAHEFSPSNDWPDVRYELKKILGINDTDLDLITSSAVLGPPLLGPQEWSLAALPAALQPPTTVQIGPPATTPGVAVSPEPVALDARVERMLRRALASFACVLLVGPPGTGKGALVRWLTAQVKEDPASFGFTSGLDPNPMWRTPDESWSSFELVGGLAPDPSGVLRWSHGLLPTALRENRWLVLDETNRADMDKIMGPLLTWLSEQTVEVGRSTAHGGDPIQIGWADTPTCQSIPAEDPTTLRAGSDWRLMGTYNPQDAQRVFRFGQALSRRFVTVPVSALEVGQFEALLAERNPDLVDEALAVIAGLYSAHRSSPATLLGPAVFLRLPKYLKTGAGPLGELLSEAYVLSLGKYLGGYDDQVFESLGQRVVADEEAMSPTDWEWIQAQRVTIG